MAKGESPTEGPKVNPPLCPVTLPFAENESCRDEPLLSTPAVIPNWPMGLR
ncbi:hypothetical protein D3C80_733930 [compost metagenome]